MDSNRELIREFILSHASREELEHDWIQFEFPQFYRNYEGLTISKMTYADHLLDYCTLQNEFPKLMGILQEKCPEAYDKEFRTKSRPVTQIIHISSTFSLAFIRIPIGEFVMGSDHSIDVCAKIDEEPQHKVHLSEYSIGKYPISKAQFYEFTYRKYGSPESTVIGFNDDPVVSVSWDEAQIFCSWLRDTTKKSIRLPTEAEWEKAARGENDIRVFPWGDRFDKRKLNSLELGLNQPMDSSEFETGLTPYGVAAMSGTVREWCVDWYSENEYERRAHKYKTIDPTGPSHGDYRVLRGGSFLSNQFHVRCAARDFELPHAKLDDIGFRLVLDE